MNWKSLILSCLAAAVTTSGASFIPKEIPRLVISYYPDSTSFGYQQWLREKDDRFESYFSLRLKFKAASACGNLLEANQLFPLNKMLSTGYLSQDQVTTLIKMGDRLKPNQFRFFELIKTEDPKDLAGKHLDATKGDIPYAIFPVLGEKVGITQATLWTVAGQTTSSHVKLSEEKMPWQLDKAYQAVKLDREKMKLVWEVGRGAQGESNSMDRLWQAAALSMLKETLAHGLRPSDSYVFMHAMGAAQARLFKMHKNSKTGKPVFATFAKGSDTDETLVANLHDILEVFRPDHFSTRLKGIVDLTNGRLDWLGAVEHLYTVRDYFRQDLDLISPSIPDRTHPIILRNGTPTAGWFMAKVSEKYGVYDAGQNISQYLSSKGWHESNVPLSWNVDSRVPNEREVARNKIIGLSNFSDKTAKANPNYAKLVLMASYFYWEKTLAKEYPRETSQLLDMTRFVIMSSHDSILEQAKNIPGGRTETFQHTDIKTEMDVSPEGSRLQPNIQIYAGPGFVFDRRSILALIQADPQLAREARGALRKGNWQVQHMSHDMGVL